MDLYKLKRKDKKRAVEVFSKAFYSEPLYQYLFPDKNTRQKFLTHIFNFNVSYGLLFGEIYAPSPKIEGLAIWYRSNRYKMNIIKLLRAGGLKFFIKLDKDTRLRVMPINRFADEMLLKYGNFLHWYLSPIAVEPKFQGKGFASLLLRSMNKRMDEEKIPGFLETLNPVNVEIYKHFDYEVVAKEIIPGTELPYWVMVRQPK